MIYTLQNTTRRMVVYQLEHRVSGGAFKSHSETTVRVSHDKNGNAEIRRVRLRHPPVLRIPAGGMVEVPASVLHDTKIARDLKASGRAPLKIVRKETPDQHRARTESEVAARKALAERREQQAKEIAARAVKRTAERTAAKKKPAAHAPAPEAMRKSKRSGADEPVKPTPIAE